MIGRRIADDSEGLIEKLPLNFENVGQPRRPVFGQRHRQPRVAIVDAHHSTGKGHHSASRLPPQNDGGEETGFRAKGGPPALVKLRGHRGRAEDLERPRTFRDAIGKPDAKASRRLRDREESQRRFDLSRRRRENSGQRKSDVADPGSLAIDDPDGRVIELALDLPEHGPRLETEIGQERREGRHPREAGASRALLQMFSPEQLRPARLVLQIADLRVTKNLRRRLEGNARVEPLEEGLQKPDSGFRPGQVQGLQDVVGRNGDGIHPLSIRLTRPVKTGRGVKGSVTRRLNSS